MYQDARDYKQPRKFLTTRRTDDNVEKQALEQDPNHNWINGVFFDC
jgi:hypothetical protein